MIVDDNPAIRAMVRELLAEETIECSDCRDGGEAVAMYKSLRPDWVVMDIMMEGMDGLQATEEILAGDPTAKIVILTQHNDAGLFRRAERIGAVDVVLKEHMDLLRELLRNAPGAS